MTKLDDQQRGTSSEFGDLGVALTVTRAILSATPSAGLVAVSVYGVAGLVLLSRPADHDAIEPETKANWGG